MSKYNSAFKLRLEQLAQEKSSGAVGSKFGARPNLIRYWSLVYLLNGAKSFVHKQLYYSREFKLKALKTMRRNNWSLGYTSAFFRFIVSRYIISIGNLYRCGGIANLI
jgi:transposase